MEQEDNLRFSPLKDLKPFTVRDFVGAISTVVPDHHKDGDNIKILAAMLYANIMTGTMSDQFSLQQTLIRC
jgi:hypothetical protein